MGFKTFAMLPSGNGFFLRVLGLQVALALCTSEAFRGVRSFGGVLGVSGSRGFGAWALLVLVLGEGWAFYCFSC